MAEIRIGTSGWFYRHWIERFYPRDIRPDAWLPHYAHHFGSVENNSAFYRLPNEKMVSGWRAKVPALFRYAVKLSRFISHTRKLQNCSKPLATFLQRVSVLGDKLAVILVQLPPAMGCEKVVLSEFLIHLPHTPRFAIEFRHDSWFCKEVYEEMSKYNCALCQSHSDRYPTSDIVTADFAYFRFHGPGRLYASKYTDEQLSDWAARIHRLASKGIDVYAYFNNDFNGYAVENAKMFQEIIFG